MNVPSQVEKKLSSWSQSSQGMLPTTLMVHPQLEHSGGSPGFGPGTQSSSWQVKIILVVQLQLPVTPRSHAPIPSEHGPPKEAHNDPSGSLQSSICEHSS